ncbi:MAG: DUF3472 domain-containing protein [Clostridia bacterium]|nr:DUF3472 domain-containing protein [Clostridia bacterium]
MNKKIIIGIILLTLVVAVAFSGLFLWKPLETDSANATVDTTTEEQENTTEKHLLPSLLLRHAPNMYIQWISENSQFDAVTIDWKCTEDAWDTYWAVHNWSYGYAGFQNFLGKHVLLLSLWDMEDGTRPTVEYSYDGYHGDFGGEGEGKHVYTNYDWKVNTWYSMKIERTYENDKTYFTQYIREENGEWLKTASISYPIEAHWLEATHVFQEDFTFNNRSRSCEVRNAGGLIANTDIWETWTECEITNSFFPTDDATWENGAMENISFDCEYKNNGESIWIQAGGYDDTPNDKTYPARETINKR